MIIFSFEKGLNSVGLVVLTYKNKSGHFVDSRFVSCKYVYHLYGNPTRHYNSIIPLFLLRSEDHPGVIFFSLGFTYSKKDDETPGVFNDNNFNFECEYFDWDLYLFDGIT